jgi:D-alanine-D-alanine ligase
VSDNFEKIVDCDVIFPVLHGSGGEDGTLQAKLEKQGVKFVGSDTRASKICFNKWNYKQLLQKSNLLTPKGNLIDKLGFDSNQLTAQPFVLKPVDGGSSIDTFIVRDPTKIPHIAIAETFDRHPSMLLEELIEGSELTVGILGEQALPIIQIIPPENGEFDYENKYNGASQEIISPKNIDPKIQRAAQDLALKAHRLTGCRDFSRTDMIVDRQGKIFVLETNTIPGMTDQSLYPKMANAAGLSMPELVTKLVNFALTR